MKMIVPSPRSSIQSGFTLYELIAVMAIVSLLITLTVPSISAITSTANINQAVQMVTQSAAVARQTAMGKGQPVALVLANSPAAAGEQSLLILTGRTDETGFTHWDAADAWKNFPQAIEAEVYDRNGEPSFYSESSSGPISGDLALPLKGNLVNAYSYIVFRPDGSVDAPENAPSLSLKRVNKDNANTDYVILVQENTGRSKVIEP